LTSLIHHMKTIAYYLGQFHPTPENNEFWGSGFTEWHNVAKARRLYPGHVQPRLPGDLGFYDLRCDETLMAQIQLARHIGIDAFCHWHYWFGGRRLLHAPLDRMIRIAPDFKFMLGWANESWTGVWHGASKRVLIEQTYSTAECIEHAFLIADYIETGTYLKVGGKFPLVIYKPNQIPNPSEYLQLLRERVHERCGAELYIIGNWTPGRSGEISSPRAIGLDAVVVTPVAAYFQDRWAQNAYAAAWQGLRAMGVGPEVRPYAQTERTLSAAVNSVTGVAHATVVTGWDNTPRSGRRGLVLTGYTEKSFRRAISSALEHESSNPSPLLFIKSWNEWAEGNVLEPIFEQPWSAAVALREMLRTGKPVPPTLSLA
jgi:hypothetical protein